MLHPDRQLVPASGRYAAVAVLRARWITSRLVSKSGRRIGHIAVLEHPLECYDASPNSITMGFGGDVSKSPGTVDSPRAALRFDALRLAEDLMVPPKAPAETIRRKRRRDLNPRPPCPYHDGANRRYVASRALSPAELRRRICDQSAFASRPPGFAAASLALRAFSKSFSIACSFLIRPSNV